MDIHDTLRRAGFPEYALKYVPKSAQEARRRFLHADAEFFRYGFAADRDAGHMLWAACSFAAWGRALEYATNLDGLDAPAARLRVLASTILVGELHGRKDDHSSRKAPIHAAFRGAWAAEYWTNGIAVAVNGMAYPVISCRPVAGRKRFGLKITDGSTRRHDGVPAQWTFVPAGGGSLLPARAVRALVRWRAHQEQGLIDRELGVRGVADRRCLRRWQKLMRRMGLEVACSDGYVSDPRYGDSSSKGQREEKVRPQ